MHILGIIPARGGSKRLKDKNILQLMGKPLISYTIESALASNYIDRIVVSTDSHKIRDIVKKMFSVEVIDRPAEFATDDAPVEEALLHSLEYLKIKEKYTADIVVFMQPNIPIRREGIVDEAVEKLLNSNADSCVSCYEVSQIPEWMKIIDQRGRLVSLSKDVNGIRKQEFPKRYLLDGSIVVLRAENLIKTRGIGKVHIYLGDEVIPIIQEEEIYSLEIDDWNDFLMAKYYLEQLNTAAGLK